MQGVTSKGIPSEFWAIQMQETYGPYQHLWVSVFQHYNLEWTPQNQVSFTIATSTRATTSETTSPSTTPTRNPTTQTIQPIPSIPPTEMPSSSPLQFPTVSPTEFPSTTPSHVPCKQY
eukprot:759204_1